MRVLIIVGPTASGKSDLAVKLARKFNGEIISADSRQVYKGLNIGTGKITKREMRGIRHHLLDVATPKNRFSVAEYKILAENNLRYIVSCGKLPIVVGGSGFYIDAITGEMNLPNVPPDQRLRQKLSQKSTETLFEMLMKASPTRAKTIDKYNKIRLIRALEIIKKIGSIPPLGSSTSKSRYRFIFIGLKPDNLDKRIYKRLLMRFNGMIREGKKLHEQGLSYKRMYELGLEYRHIALYLQKKLTREEMVEKLYMAIKHYAKRQMTWFKRNKEIRWFALNSVKGFKPEEYKEIEKYIEHMLG